MAPNGFNLTSRRVIPSKAAAGHEQRLAELERRAALEMDLHAKDEVEATNKDQKFCDMFDEEN